MLLALTLDVSQTAFKVSGQVVLLEGGAAFLPLSISNMMYESAVIPLRCVSAVKALITRLSPAVRPIEALQQSQHFADISTLLKAFNLMGRNFMFSHSLLIICQALCKGCSEHV